MSTRSERRGCLLGWLLGLLRGPRGRAGEGEDLPYERRPFLLSPAERSFYGVLRDAAGDTGVVFAKVRLADLLTVARGVEHRQRHQNRIQMKHVDFVLCSPDDLRPLLLIELDDASHERDERRERDEFVDGACAAAGLPLLRVAARRGYSRDELAEEVRRALG